MLIHSGSTYRSIAPSSLMAGSRMRSRSRGRHCISDAANDPAAEPLAPLTISNPKQQATKVAEAGTRDSTLDRCSDLQVGISEIHQ